MVVLLLLSLLLLRSPLSSADNATNSSNLKSPLEAHSSNLTSPLEANSSNLTSPLEANSSNLTSPLEANSSAKANVPNPTVSLALSLGVSQELNPNPFVKPNPVLSLSLSLSVSEEFKANPFDFTLLPLPDDAEQWQVKKRERKVEAHHPLSDDPVSDPKAMSSSPVRGKCPYTVRIKTSCSSPPVTRDAVSLNFGDAARNEVYAARLDDPTSGTFERCSTDTFRIVGPCGGRPCFLYLRRSGRDGWIPEYAKIFYQPGDTRASVTFAYEASLPDSVWYGFNLCHGGAAAAVHAAAGDEIGVRSGGDEDDQGEGGDPTYKMKTKVSGSVKTVFKKI